MKFKLFCICVFTLFFFACGTDDDEGLVETQFIGTNYFQLTTGQVSIFDVDTIRYNDFNGNVDTLRFQKREVVKEQLQDSSGRSSFLVEVSERTADTLAWRVTKVIRKTATAANIERLEDNLLQVLLIFPIRNDKKWNRNILNANDELEVEYDAVNQPFENYDSTLTILIREETNLIEQIETTEKYANGFGLILRKDKDLQTELNGTIRAGYIATESLVEFRR